jgi:AcrR family transcriptional regulator
MQTGVRRGRPGHDLESVLRGAVKVFNERGYDGTSMEDLSRELGITKSAIYHHVPGKEELLRLAVDRALDGLFAVLDEISAMEAPAIARLEELARRSVLLLVAELPFVTLLLRVRGNTAAERRALARRRAFDAAVADLVSQARDEGDLRPDLDPALAARLLYGMINSVVEWYRQPGGRPGELADSIVAVAFGGLRRSLPLYRGRDRRRDQVGIEGSRWFNSLCEPLRRATAARQSAALGRRPSGRRRRDRHGAVSAVS